MTMTRFLHSYPFRFLIFFIGVLFMALGIALTTKPNLGTTPISALPFVASLGLPFSLGFFTGAVNLAMVGAQKVLLKERFARIQYLQIPVACAFGLLIDFWMGVLPDPSADPYLLKCVYLAAGAFVLAFGVFVEVSANVVVMPGEGMVLALAVVLQRDFGTLKVVFDTTLVVLAALLSLVLFHDIQGLREGTVFSALLVGFLVKMFFSLREKLFRSATATSRRGNL